MKKSLLVLLCFVLVQISAFSQATFTITASAGPNGTISPVGSVIVTSGANQTFNISANSGYYISAVLVDGVSVGVPASYTFNNVTTAHSISVSFNLIHLALDKPTTAQSSQSFGLSPKANDADGTNNSYWSADPYPQWWKVDLQGIYNLSSVVIRNYVEAGRYYHYNIEVSTDDVTYTQIAEKINNNVTTDAGDTYSVTATARYIRVNMILNSVNTGVQISDFRVYGTAATSNTIVSSTDLGGLISPLGTVMVKNGSNQTFSITPKSGYKISDVKVDNISVGALPTYTFSNVTAPHTITATFSHLPHLALNKTATAQSNLFDGLPSYANDDPSNTLWASLDGYPQWWMVDLGAVYDITNIVIRNYVDGTRYYNYNIEASSNGSTYTKIAEKLTTNVATDAGDSYNLITSARYLRVNVTFNSANVGAHISDFRVYGTSYLTVANVTANTKVYDGTTVATLNTGTAALVGVIPGDEVNLVATSATGSFADKNIGTNKLVTTTGFTLSGANVAKYTLVQPVAAADITVKELTVGGTFTASNKNYNGTTAATIATNNLTLPAKASGDIVNLTAVAVFADNTVGTAKTVSLTGSSITGGDAANYILSLTGAPTTAANIIAKALYIGGTFTANNKIYDGTTAATIATNSLTLLTKVGSDDVTLTSVAVFANQSAGTGKTVSLTGSSLAGVDNANYTLSMSGAPTALANITPKEITITPTAGQSKIFEAADPVFLYTNSEWSDNLNFTGALGRATGETAGVYAYTLNTLSAGTNYTLVLVASPATFEILNPTGIEDGKDVSGGLTLKNYPNPFTASTKISYSLPFDGHVNLAIRNLSGQVLKTIVNEEATKGDYNLNLEDVDLQAGVFILTLRLEHNGKELNKTIRLVKGR